MLTVFCVAPAALFRIDSPHKDKDADGRRRRRSRLFCFRFGKVSGTFVSVLICKKAVTFQHDDLASDLRKCD
jgi:hypothetical protein